MSTLFEKIKEVTELDGIAGYEHQVRHFLRQKMTPLVDRVETDGLGGIFGIKESQAVDAPKILVAAHMDEVGFMVTEIKANGSLSVVGIGGWNSLVVSSQRFTLYTRQGKAIPVVSGSVPPHFLRGAAASQALPAVSDIIFDAGFSDKAEAESFGLAPGDIIVPQAETILTANQKNVISKAWDNRYGVLMVTELLEALKDQALNNHLIAGAAHLQNNGVPSTTIGVCARYIHSHQTLYALDDFIQAQAFLQAIVKKLDRTTVNTIKGY